MPEADELVFVQHDQPGEDPGVLIVGQQADRDFLQGRGAVQAGQLFKIRGKPPGGFLDLAAVRPVDGQGGSSGLPVFMADRLFIEREAKVVRGGQDARMEETLLLYGAAGGQGPAPGQLHLKRKAAHGSVPPVPDGADFIVQPAAVLPDAQGGKHVKQADRPAVLPKAVQTAGKIQPVAQLEGDIAAAGNGEGQQAGGALV